MLILISGHPISVIIPWRAGLRPPAILEAGSTIDVQAGGMVRQHPEPLDLCKECSDRFSDWLRSAHQANHSGPGGALAETAVASHGGELKACGGGRRTAWNADPAIRAETN